MRHTVRWLLLAVAVLAMAASSALAKPSDSFTGTWRMDDGDGSTSQWIFSAPLQGGVRQFTLTDSYATFCELAGPGTGSRLEANGTAVDDGNTIEITVTSFTCSNGDAGARVLPIEISATIVDGRLEFEGGFFATRVGRA